MKTTMWAKIRQIHPRHFTFSLISPPIPLPDFSEHPSFLMIPFFPYLFNTMYQADSNIGPGCTVQSVMTFLAKKGNSTQVATPFYFKKSVQGAYVGYLGKTFFSKARSGILLPYAVAALCS